jgi:hypothetical protein
MAGRWVLEPCEGAVKGSEAVEDLLDMPLLQRLAAHRAVEIEILETDETLEIVQVRHMCARRQKFNNLICQAHLLIRPGLSFHPALH